MLSSTSVVLAANASPIAIGVIASSSATAGKAIFQGAELAAKAINANGGIDGRPVKLHKYEVHFSTSQASRAFQRAVNEDHVVAVVGSFASEVALAITPWAARLKTPFIATGAASPKVTDPIRKNYQKYKYVFQEVLNSHFAALQVCQYARDVLVNQLGYKTAVIMNEDYAWTKVIGREYKKCLPKYGLKVLDTIRFSGDTRDFTPIFNRIEKDYPDVIITGLAHTGVKPTVQWTQHKVPFLMAGISTEAMSGKFWSQTNGAAQGVITQTYGSALAKLTHKTRPFSKTFYKKFHVTPAYDAYTTYDSLFVLRNAIGRADSTKADAIVKQLEKTNYVGTIGRVQFYGRKAKYPHAMKYGKHYVRGVAIQWQNGKQQVIWPKSASSAKVMVPGFVKNARSGN
jgi:branched-chain amino acid transport system substrate-binding protein